MVTKIFLDINVVLDILDDKRPFHSFAVTLYQFIEANKADAFISESILATTDYILQKTTGKETRITLFSELLDYLQVLPCSNKICRAALQNKFSDLEDALLYQVAIEHSVDYFITNDKSLKKLSVPGLPVISTNEFLKINW